MMDKHHHQFVLSDFLMRFALHGDPMKGIIFLNLDHHEQPKTSE